MPRDALIGTVLLAFAGLYWLAAGGIHRSSLEDSIGAAGVPNTLAALLAGLAVLLILRSFFSRSRSAPRVSGDTPDNAPVAHLRALGMLVLGIGYLLIVPSLGYTLSVAFLIAAVALYNHQQATWRLALFTGLLAVGLYFLFVRVLGIPLPPGVWPDLLPI